MPRIQQDPGQQANSADPLIHPAIDPQILMISAITVVLVASGYFGLV